MKVIVLSGINLFEGGPLSVYHDFLRNMIGQGYHKKNKIIAFVHKKELFNEFIEYDNINFIELPESRTSYIFRLWYEFVYFYFFSKKRSIDIWISLHDITPNVVADKRYVYCHNPSPFMEKNLRNFKYSYKTSLFSLFYKYLYRINIKRNTDVIVQHDWIREKFKEFYNIENVIVAKPSMDFDVVTYITGDKAGNKEKIKFIYPAYPRVFKNIEVICSACLNLEERNITGFEVLLTIDGTENNYSREIFEKYKDLSNLNFIGLQPRKNIFQLYDEVDYLIFPSKLETWGLPISEFKITDKPIILADLPYAHETLGTYHSSCFFNPNKPEELELIIENILKGDQSQFKKTFEQKIEEPYCPDWNALLEMILA